MIKDTEKFTRLKKELYLKMKGHRLSLINDFDTLYSDAFDKSYPGFEKNFNPNLGYEEIGFLYKAVKNRILTELKNINNSAISFLEDIKGVEKIYATDEEEEIIDQIDRKNFSEVRYSESDFLRKFISNKVSKGEIKEDEWQLLLKTFELQKPIFRLNAWTSELKLNNQLVDKLTQPLVSNFNSPHYFQWNHETLFVRLKAWLVLD